MATITEDYVSFETAKLLKDKRRVSMKLIDKDALVAEFNRLITELAEGGEDTMFEQGRISAFEDAKIFIDTLEVKEVDLEKEVKTDKEKLEAIREDERIRKVLWGEEDENIFENLIELIEQSDEEKGFVKFRNRLKSLGLQNKCKSSAWSEEDEKIIKRIGFWLYSRCKGREYEEIHNWLKSLKSRVQSKQN